MLPALMTGPYSQQVVKPNEQRTRRSSPPSTHNSRSNRGTSKQKMAMQGWEVIGEFFASLACGASKRWRLWTLGTEEVQPTRVDRGKVWKGRECSGHIRRAATQPCDSWGIAVTKAVTLILSIPLTLKRATKTQASPTSPR